MRASVLPVRSSMRLLEETPAASGSSIYSRSHNCVVSPRQHWQRRRRQPTSPTAVKQPPSQLSEGCRSAMAYSSAARWNKNLCMLCPALRFSHCGPRGELSGSQSPGLPSDSDRPLGSSGALGAPSYYSSRTAVCSVMRASGVTRIPMILEVTPSWRASLDSNIMNVEGKALELALHCQWHWQSADRPGWCRAIMIRLKWAWTRSSTTALILLLVVLG